MASITLMIANSNESIPVNEVDLDVVTNKEILDAAVSGGTIPEPQTGYEYLLVGKDGKPISEQKTLSELGFVDGDTIKVLQVAKGA